MVLWQTTVYKIIYSYNIRNESVDHQTQMKLIYLFIYSNLFPYIPFRYIPWEWKKSHSLYILRHLQSDTTDSRLERIHKNHNYNLHNLTLYTEY
jgi:hypothetical protein